MKFELDNYNRNVSDDFLLLDLRTVAKKLGKNSLTRQEYDINGKCHSSTQCRRFGSWINALKKAKLQQTRTSPNVPEEELFKNLEEVWIKLGRQPRYDEMQRPFSKFLVDTYKRRFGGWRKALECFVEYVNNEEGITSQEAINKIKKAEFPAQHKTPRTVNWRLRFIVMKQDNFKCKHCGRSPATNPTIVLHVDHKKAWANGGETVLENLQTLCSKCNIGKSNLE